MISSGRIVKSLALAGTLLVLALKTSLPAPAQNGGDQTVQMNTSKGPIRMRIFYSIMPNTAGNFLDLVDSGFYNGLTFHRVENWVVQGGDPNGNGSGYATDPNTGQAKYLRLETNPNLNHNQAGMVAMARGNNINSASCQFYILKCAMPQLNGKYAVFGRVLSGMDAVYAMRPGDRIISATVLAPQSSPSPSNASPASESGDSGSSGSSGKQVKPRDSGF